MVNVFNCYRLLCCKKKYAHSSLKKLGKAANSRHNKMQLLDCKRGTANNRARLQETEQVLPQLCVFLMGTVATVAKKTIAK